MKQLLKAIVDAGVGPENVRAEGPLRQGMQSDRNHLDSLADWHTSHVQPISPCDTGRALFVGVEVWYALGHQGFLEGKVPAQFLITIRNASVYNVALLTIAFAYYNRAVLNSTQRALDKQSARSESLLLNILPKSIAERLKNSTEVIADHVSEVSIIFADLVGFTEMSRNMDAGQLVSMLNEVFLGFDRAAKRLGLEKIKTIGDAYMVVAGTPDARMDHVQAAARNGLGYAEAQRNLIPSVSWPSPAYRHPHGSHRRRSHRREQVRL
jgi:hypothetical protein